MLAAIGVGSVEELFAEIPEGVRLRRPLDLPDGKSESEVFDHLSGAGVAQPPRRRRGHLPRRRHVRPLRAGDHRLDPAALGVPDALHALPARDLPGRAAGDVRVPDRDLELTGLPVSNASVYEGPSAVAAAGYLAKLETKRSKLVVSRGVHPHSREALRTHAAGYRMEVVEVPLTAEGATDVDALAALVDDDTAAVFVQQPNFLGTVEELGELGEAAKRTGALFVVAADPLPLGILKPPGELGADICVGEGQTLGNRLDFGGPSLRLLRGRRALPPQDARADRRRDARRRRQARLRAHPADPRAAHPPREGHPQHLHRAGAERAGGRDLPLLAGQARRWSSSAS